VLELTCPRLDLCASWLSASWFVRELSCYRIGPTNFKRVGDQHREVVVAYFRLDVSFSLLQGGTNNTKEGDLHWDVFQHLYTGV